MGPLAMTGMNRMETAKYTNQLTDVNSAHLLADSQQCSFSGVRIKKKLLLSLSARGVSVCIRCTLSYSVVSDRGEPEVLENRG